MGDKKKVGRRRIQLSEDRVSRFVAAVRLGCPIKDACGCAGWSPAWYYSRADEARKSPKTARSREFSEFLDQIKEAEGEATSRWLAIIEKAATGGTWQAAAWKLERLRGMVAKVETNTTIEHKVTDADISKKLLDKLSRFSSDGEEE